MSSLALRATPIMIRKLLMKIEFSSNFTEISSTLDTCSRGAEKYFRRGSRLNWPEGAVSRESIRAVKKLDRLKVIFIFSGLDFIFKPWILGN